MGKVEMVADWRAKIDEIKSTGNCKTSFGGAFFQSPRNRYTPDQMITYCQRMIEKIEKED